MQILRLEILCESSAIRMKYQALSSLKIRLKKKKKERNVVCYHFECRFKGHFPCKVSISALSLLDSLYSLILIYLGEVLPF